MSEILTLNDFYGEMAERGLRLGHQFQVQFSPNAAARSIIQSKGSSDLEDILENVSYYATTANLPGRTQLMHGRKYLGYPVQIPTTMDYTKTIQMEMICDSGSAIGGAPGETGSRLRKALLLWMHLHSDIDIDDGFDGYSGGGVKRIPADSKVYLKLLDENLKTVVETYTLHGAFIAECGDMALAHDNTDPATFSLTVAYNYFTAKQEG